ncbi:hypothetical protein M3Y97_00668300 [Aphelenchoides bicaudatus]|nr:hypothetical protein M3Y97_00668300 [Aphelenchoides bicaudatus]
MLRLQFSIVILLAILTVYGTPKIATYLNDNVPVADCNLSDSRSVSTCTICSLGHNITLTKKFSYIAKLTELEHPRWNETTELMDSVIVDGKAALNNLKPLTNYKAAFMAFNGKTQASYWSKPVNFTSANASIPCTSSDTLCDCSKAEPMAPGLKSLLSSVFIFLGA